MVICSLAQLRRIEQHAAQEGLDLMARAGRAAADFAAGRPAGGGGGRGARPTPCGAA